MLKSFNKFYASSRLTTNRFVYCDTHGTSLRLYLTFPLQLPILFKNQFIASDL